mgnify:CR=1 FL=1
MKGININCLGQDFCKQILDGDKTIDEWHKLAKSNTIDVVTKEWKQYKKAFKTIDINSFNEDDKGLILADFPEDLNLKNQGLGNKEGFFLSPGLTPFSQVVGKSSFFIKLVSVLINASQDYSLFKFPIDFDIDSDTARRLLSNLKNCEKQCLMPWIKETLNISEDQSRTIELKLLKQLAGYRRFADHKGLCCPHCSADKCDSTRMPKSNIDISFDKEPLDFTFDECDNFRAFVGLFDQNMSKFLDTIKISEKISDDRILGGVQKCPGKGTDKISIKDSFKEYCSRIDKYNKGDDFKYAMLLDFSNNFLSMLIQNRDSADDHDKKQKLDLIITKFKDLLKDVLRQFLQELNKDPIEGVDRKSSLYVSRFYYAEWIKFSSILLSEETSEQSESGIPSFDEEDINNDARMYLEQIKINLKDKSEESWFSQFHITSKSPMIKGVDVTKSTSEQIANYCGGISANLLTGEQGVGKSETKKNSDHPLIVNDKGERLTDGEPPYLRLSEDRLVKVFELNNDEAGTQKGDGAYPKGQFRITFDKSKKEKVLRDFTALGIEFEEINNGDASLDDSEGVVAGCICCKDRDIALQMLADISSVGNEMTRAILIEPTGIADGSGILNMSHVPLGRVFWDQNIMFANPQNPVWGNIESIVDFCKDQGIGYDGFKDLEFDEVSDQGLKDCLSTNNISTGIQFNRLKTLLAPCLLATGVVINDRGGFPLDGQKARFEKIMSFVNDHSEFDVQVLNCKTEQLKLEEFKHSIQLRSVGVEIDDFDGEFAKTNQVAGLFQLSMEPDRFTEVEDYFLGMLASCLDDGSIKREKGATPRGDEVEVAVNRLYYLSKVISDERISELKIRAQAALKKIQQKLKDEIRNKHKKHQESLALLNSISKEACGKNFDDISCFLDLDKVNSEIDKAIKK